MSVTPDFVGQVYKDTNTGNIWRANSTTPGDWTLESCTSFLWTPAGYNFNDVFPWVAYDGMPGLTELAFVGKTIINQFDFEFFVDLKVFNFPNLTAMDVWLGISHTDALETLNFPVLASWIQDADIKDNPLLTTINIPQAVFSDTIILTLTDNALSSSTVNSLLARAVASPAYVSGSINMSGGTSAAPSGQGIVDKATLIARGITVTTN